MDQEHSDFYEPHCNCICHMLYFIKDRAIRDTNILETSVQVNCLWAVYLLISLSFLLVSEMATAKVVSVGFWEVPPYSQTYGQTPSEGGQSSNDATPTKKKSKI